MFKRIVSSDEARFNDRQQILLLSGNDERRLKNRNGNRRPNFQNWNEVPNNGNFGLTRCCRYCSGSLSTEMTTMENKLKPNF